MGWEDESYDCLHPSKRYALLSQSYSIFSVLGKVLSAVGSAQLLMSQKFQQFRGLCEQNLVSVILLPPERGLWLPARSPSWISPSEPLELLCNMEKVLPPYGIGKRPGMVLSGSQYLLN